MAFSKLVSIEKYLNVVAGRDMAPVIIGSSQGAARCSTAELVIYR